MRKTLENSRDELTDFIFGVIEEGDRNRKMVDGSYISESTRELRKALQMNSVEVCHFVKRHLLGVNFGNKVVVIERKQGSNGSNRYKVVDINGTM